MKLRETLRTYFKRISRSRAVRMTDEQDVVVFRARDSYYGTQDPKAIALFYNYTQKPSKCRNCNNWLHGCQKAAKGLTGIEAPVVGFCAKSQGHIYEVILDCTETKPYEDPTRENPELRRQLLSELEEFLSGMDRSSYCVGSGNRRVSKRGEHMD